jgi:hypothetical protein
VGGCCIYFAIWGVWGEHVGLAGCAYFRRAGTQVSGNVLGESDDGYAQVNRLVRLVGCAC